MLKSKYSVSIFLALIVANNSTFINISEVKNNFLQWTTQFFTEAGTSSNGLFDFSDITNKILQWKSQKLAVFCPSYGAQLQNLLNLVCSTAQPTNVTARDACIRCFTAVTSMSEGPQELNSLSTCALQYFVNTPYESCARAIMALSTSALNVQPSGCFMGYCDFVRCLRGINSINLIIQCTREARTGVNINNDGDNIRFYSNVTSCILAKTRCGTFNPITGETQTPGFMMNGVRVSNALQFTQSGELRIIAIPMTTPVSNSFCAASANLTESSWLTNVC